jgi:hypothetical protein
MTFDVYLILPSGALYLGFVVADTQATAEEAAAAKWPCKGVEKLEVREATDDLDE